MTTLYCAICGQRFEPDDDHVWISAEWKYMQDRNELDEFAFHQMCWDRLSEGWMEPV